ncbi:hypothetical protein RRG08_022607 [Elysia crispata]|uniref:Uncharacterized protein n=1 Tax=Elysia crispata TaxID=231223 RepID=A0AAE1D8I5_9GAST|nr:hypothetical protein RRG08_022607 [Elysia crispata]
MILSQVDSSSSLILIKTSSRVECAREVLKGSGNYPSLTTAASTQNRGVHWGTNSFLESQGLLVTVVSGWSY